MDPLKGEPTKLESDSNNQQTQFKLFDEENKKINVEIEKQTERLKLLQERKKQLLSQKYTYCEETNGHNFIYEYECGPYGGRFKYCDKCDFEY